MQASIIPVILSLLPAHVLDVTLRREMDGRAGPQEP